MAISEMMQIVSAMLALYKYTLPDLDYEETTRYPSDRPSIADRCERMVECNAFRCDKPLYWYPLGTKVDVVSSQPHCHHLTKSNTVQC